MCWRNCNLTTALHVYCRLMQCICLLVRTTTLSPSGRRRNAKSCQRVVKVHSSKEWVGWVGARKDLCLLHTILIYSHPLLMNGILQNRCLKIAANPQVSIVLELGPLPSVRPCHWAPAHNCQALFTGLTHRITCGRAIATLKGFVTLARPASSAPSIFPCAALNLAISSRARSSPKGSPTSWWAPPPSVVQSVLWGRSCWYCRLVHR